MKNDQLFSEIQSHMRRFEDVWYKRTEEGMEVYIADIKEFFVDNGGYVEQYKNVNGDEHQLYDKPSYLQRFPVHSEVP